MRYRIYRITIHLIVVMGIACSFFTALCDTNFTSKTAIFMQPAYHNIALWSGAWELLLTRKRCTTPFQLAIQVIPFYQKAINNDKARDYFSLNCKDVLVVAGDESSQTRSRDIRAELLGITDPAFESVLTLQPRQHQAGLTATIPAANVLTQLVRVKPNSFVNLSTSIALSTDCMQWEIGYPLWSHSGEHVSRQGGCCAKGVVPFLLYGIADTNSPTSTASANLSTINELAPVDHVFGIIKSTDIEYRSGAARHSSVQEFHSELYFSQQYQERTLVCGFGGFYMTAITMQF